jgi:hypothetical protein
MFMDASDVLLRSEEESFILALRFVHSSGTQESGW